MVLMWFQAAASVEAAQKVESIVVTARPAQVRDKIDRRVYDIRSDAGSQGGVALDVLNRIPSVTVSPTGRIALRGDPGVQILINGKPPVAGTSVLKSLPASSVDSVEVMTNPSAQFSPDGTAGIINIVTRKARALGISGTISARADTRQKADLSASASATKGDWSVDGRVFLGHSPSETNADYSQRDAASGRGLVSRDNHGTSTLDMAQASLGVTRRLAKDRELSVEAHHMGGRIRANDLATTRRSAASLQSSRKRPGHSATRPERTISKPAIPTPGPTIAARWRPMSRTPRATSGPAPTMTTAR